MSELNVTVEATIPVATKTKARKVKAPKAIDLREVQLRVDRLTHAKATAKALYEECDRIEAELIAMLGKDSATLSDGRVVKVKNNFFDAAGNPKNVAFKPCGVKLNEIVVK